MCGQVRFTEAGLGRCMEALAAEVGGQCKGEILAGQPLIFQEESGLKTAVCNEDSIMQRWQWDPYCPPSQAECPESESGVVEVSPNQTYAALKGKGLLKLAGTKELCLTVGSKETERKAGPYIRRDLLLQSCNPNEEAMMWLLVI